MPSIKEALASLDKYFFQIAKLKRDLQENMDQDIPKPLKDELQGLMEKQLEVYERSKVSALEELICFPPQFSKHFEKLTDFHQVAPYKKSVFIMTKFPNVQNPGPTDAELTRVIKAAQDAVTASGFIPRLAYDRRYHPGLWDNVETYLCGCGLGIAIVESKHQNELNPNVTMEWGWMRAMGKDVLYLVEKTFDRKRADTSGLLEDPFTWDNPEPEITASISQWLKNVDI
jgi:hypothetical protein